jgi:hypothetical protein
MPGAFGVVSLVRERTTGKLFAMKQVRAFHRYRYMTLITLYARTVAQDGYVKEGPGGTRSRRA